MLDSTTKDKCKMVILLADAQATLSLGFTLGQHLTAGSVILLEGDLGTGKTTLVQGIGLGLGITEPIVSPTFTLINEYTQGRFPLYHLDLYRLDTSEVLNLHLETYWEGMEVIRGIMAIEWADRMLEKPESYLKVLLTHRNNGAREAEITPYNCTVHHLINFSPD